MSVLNNVQQKIAIIGGAMVLLGGTLLFLLVRRTFKPLDALRLSMGALATGDCDVAVPSADRGDEIGRMAAAVQVFKDNAHHSRALQQEQIEATARRATENARFQAEAEAERAAAALVVHSIGTRLERLAAGDLTFKVETVLPLAYEKLRTDLNSTVDRLESLMRGIAQHTSGIKVGTNDIAHAADDLSRRTAQHAASLKQTSAAVGHITAAARKAADGAKEVSDDVSSTKTEAEQSGLVVHQAIAAMGVEAARAGDAGRGFAVVARQQSLGADHTTQTCSGLTSLNANLNGLLTGLVDNA